jgi:integrase
VKGRSVTWSFRGPRLGGKNRRWTVGDHSVAPPEARQRAWQVRTRISQGLDPKALLTELLTGLKQLDQLDIRVAERPSWKWEDAIARYSAWVDENKRRATTRDYIPTLLNTPELAICRGRLVCDIVREEIEEAVEKVRLRGVKTHHRKVLVVCRRFFNWLAEGPRRRETSVPVNFLLGAKAGDPLRNVLRRVVNKGIPDVLPIGRALAIARSGVLGELPSAAIELLIGTAQRRRAIVGVRNDDIDFSRGLSGGLIWFQPPYFRKTADRLQSSAAHQVPVVGFAVHVIMRLERRLASSHAYIDSPLREAEAKSAGRELEPWDWYFPVARERRRGIANVQPYMSESTLNHNIAAMPGVKGALSPHALRRAFGSYGTLVGGFADGEAKLILDHLEGVGDDVTRGHYDLDPRIKRKHELMVWWTSWLEEQCAAAIAADPILSDPEALREACYRTRYGEELWQRKLAKTRNTGAPLWPKDGFDEDAA